MDDAIRRAFPEIDEIENARLRERTRDAWVLVSEENGIDDLATVPWFPPEQERLGASDEFLAAHVRDVVAAAMALAEALIDRRGATVDRDLVRAGALLHDVGKCYEFDGADATPIGRHVGHPYYGIYVVGRAGLGAEIANVVLSHTDRTNVEPTTIEAEIVRRADEAAAAAIRDDAVGDPLA